MTNLKHRMYGFVPYNLSPIQQGIQFGHAVVEYSISKHNKSAPYKKWSQKDKTFMILNGGTTNNSNKGEKPSGMSVATWALHENNIPFAVFQEPDLNDATTGIAFVVDERVYDKEKYPCPFDKIVPRFESIPLDMRVQALSPDFNVKKYNAWVKSIGGKQNEFLRHFLPNYRLA